MHASRRTRGETPAARRGSAGLAKGGKVAPFAERAWGGAGHDSGDGPGVDGKDPALSLHEQGHLLELLGPVEGDSYRRNGWLRDRFQVGMEDLPYRRIAKRHDANEPIRDLSGRWYALPISVLLSRVVERNQVFSTSEHRMAGRPSRLPRQVRPGASSGSPRPTPSRCVAAPTDRPRSFPSAFSRVPRCWKDPRTGHLPRCGNRSPPA